MAKITLNTLTDCIARYLKQVQGVNKVDTRWGGQATWVQTAKPKQSYFIVVPVSRQVQAAGASGPQAFRFPVVRIEGWGPHNYENPNTTVWWNDLLDGICDHFMANQSLGGLVMDLGLPTITINNLEWFEGGGTNVPKILCHHAQIDMRTQEYMRFETQ